MPHKPLRPCRYPGCPNLSEQPYCENHRSENPNVRLSAAERGYDSKWRVARARFLKKSPLCRKCLAEGRLVPATVVDHIKPHRGDKELFWDEDNFQALCARCHNEKTGHGL